MIRIGFIFFFSWWAALCADWDPTFLNIETSKMQVLKADSYNDLKRLVFKYLENSWCSEEKANLLMELILLTQPKICVEIGVFTGSTTLPILTTLQLLGKGSLCAIDSWDCKASIDGLPASDLNTKWWGSLDMEAIQGQFKHMLNSWSLASYCEIFPMTSKKAANYISSIDFLHLDGNFSEEGALLDSKLYVPKVNPGGYVLLSNVHVMIAGRPSKMKALTVLLDSCKVICEVDNGQTLLFRKNPVDAQVRNQGIFR